MYRCRLERSREGAVKEAVKSPVSSVAQNNVKLRKDFKLSGQIYSKKKSISYTSLIRQTEAGIKKETSFEGWIIDSVLRGVIPFSSLRSNLDGRQDLSLPTLRGILRAHYAEKNYVELYNELDSSD